MLTICGNNSTVHKHPVFQSDDEIWVMNGKGCTLPRYDRVFQMHLPCDWGGQWSQRWLRENTKIPVFMREVHSDIPMSQRYPFEEVFGMLEKTNVKPITSTICWAMALAILENRPEIRVVGIEMQDKEYIEQKDGFAFWIGFAAGRGLKLEVESKMFDGPLYGSYPLQQKA